MLRGKVNGAQIVPDHPVSLGIRDQEIPLSPLLAHTSTTARCKSFISTHMAFDPRGRGTIFFERAFCVEGG